MRLEHNCQDPVQFFGAACSASRTAGSFSQVSASLQQPKHAIKMLVSVHDGHNSSHVKAHIVLDCQTHKTVMCNICLQHMRAADPKLSSFWLKALSGFVNCWKHTDSWPTAWTAANCQSLRPSLPEFAPRPHAPLTHCVAAVAQVNPTLDSFYNQ
jgi:hypothetical protein